MSGCHATRSTERIPYVLDQVGLNGIGYKKTQLFRNAPDDLIEAARTEDIISFSHVYCVTEQKFRELHLHSHFNIISTNKDDKGVEYISTVEHKTFPFFGFQWHPEKAPFEWSRNNIPHTLNAVMLHHHVMEVFVNASRRNLNRFSTPEEEDSRLLHNYQPIFIQPFYNSSFQQIYALPDTRPAGMRN